MSRFICIVAYIKTSFLFRAEQYFIVCVHHILFYSSIRQEPVVVCIFCLLWKMLLWIFLYKYMFKFLFSVLFCISPEVALLDHIVILCLIFWWPTRLFPTAAVPFCILTSNAQEFQLLYILCNSCHFVFFKDFIYLFIFRERGREGEIHQCEVVSRTPPSGDLAHNSGTCPDWESNQWPFDSQAGIQCTEPH